MIGHRTRSGQTTAASLLLHLETIGTWQGDDFDECLQAIELKDIS
jgi:hypothetical protein